MSGPSQGCDGGPLWLGKRAPTFVPSTQFLRYQPAGLLELLFVVAGLRHSHRNAVRGVDKVCCLATVLRNFRQRVLQAIYQSIDEPGMVVEHADLFYNRRALAHCLLRAISSRYCRQLV